MVNDERKQYTDTKARVIHLRTLSVHPVISSITKSRKCDISGKKEGLNQPQTFTSMLNHGNGINV